MPTKVLNMLLEEAQVAQARTALGLIWLLNADNKDKPLVPGGGSWGGSDKGPTGVIAH